MIRLWFSSSSNAWAIYQQHGNSCLLRLQKRRTKRRATRKFSRFVDAFCWTCQWENSHESVMWERKKNWKFVIETQNWSTWQKWVSRESSTFCHTFQFSFRFPSRVRKCLTLFHWPTGSVFGQGVWVFVRVILCFRSFFMPNSHASVRLKGYNTHHMYIWPKKDLQPPTNLDFFSLHPWNPKMICNDPPREVTLLPVDSKKRDVKSILFLDIVSPFEFPSHSCQMNRKFYIGFSRNRDNLMN